MKKVLLLCLIVGLVFTGCAQTTKKQPEKSKKAKDLSMEDTGIAARVNQKEITREELNKRLEALYGKQVLDRMIDEELVRQAGELQKVKIKDEEVEKKLADIKKNFPTDADFNRALAQSQMTIENLKKQIRIQLTLEKVAQAEVSDKEVEDFMKSTPENKNLNKEQVKEFLRQQKITRWLEKERTTAKIDNYLTRKSRDLKKPAGK